MDFTDIALRAVGAFYAFAGVVATRASITAAMIDRAIATISLEKISVREAARTWWLFAGAVLTFAGGLALAVQLDIAVWLFVASAVGQALYLAILAPLYFDAEEPADASGRRGTINAFAIYLVATAFVLWAGQQGRLQPFEAASPAALAIARDGARGLSLVLGFDGMERVRDRRPPLRRCTTIFQGTMFREIPTIRRAARRPIDSFMWRRRLVPARLRAGS